MRAMKVGNGTPPAAVGVMVLVDRSGSMHSIREAMEREFADFVAEQRAAESVGELWLTLAQFDADGLPTAMGGPRPMRYERKYHRTPIDDVGPLGLSPRGVTPLCDAIVRFAEEARAVIDDEAEADATGRLLLVIITDGNENASEVNGWAEARAALDALTDIEGVDLLWLGTSEAIEHVSLQVPALAMGGHTYASQTTAQMPSYSHGLLKAATLGVRHGLDAVTVASTYVSATSGGEQMLSNARIKELVDEVSKREHPSAEQ